MLFEEEGNRQEERREKMKRELEETYKRHMTRTPMMEMAGP